MRDAPRIWIVEDNLDDLEIARLAVGRVVPCVVEAFTDAEAVVARLDAGVPLPDLFLIDLGLPVMGGLDLLRHVRGRTSAQVPVIMLTTADDDDGILDCYAAGASSYVRKPATESSFTDALRILTHTPNANS